MKDEPDGWTHPGEPTRFPRLVMREPTRRRLAWVALVVGLLCSFVVAAISIDYELGQAAGDAPSVSLVYGLRQAPFLLIGVPLLVAGAVSVTRSWSAEHPRLPIVAAIAALCWFVVVIGGPSMFV